MKANDIIEQIRSGGTSREQGVKCFIDSYYRPMVRFFISQGLQPQDAADVFQDTAIKLFEKAGQYIYEGKAEAWLWQIARNTLIDHQRKWGRRGKVEFMPGDEEWDAIMNSTPAVISMTSEESVDECVDRGMARFRAADPERAYALVLQLEDKSIDEIAVVIGRTKGATKEYLSQCRKKLAPFIDHCHELLTT